MSSGINRFSTAETVVFWNLDKCPIPNELSPASISDNIKLALKNIGYNGQLSINAYTDTEQMDRDFESAGIKLIKANPGLSVGLAMTIAVFSWWGEEERYEPKNLLVISQEYFDMFQGFVQTDMNDNNLLLAHPKYEEIPCNASYIWLWDSLSSGGSPFHNKWASLRIATPSPTTGKKCKSRFLTAETVVFWDLADCPIPNDLSLASIDANIRLALNNLGYTGKVSILAYAQTQEEQIKKEEFDSVNIHLTQIHIPGGAHVVMNGDIYGWWGSFQRDKPGNVLVISQEAIGMFVGFAHAYKKNDKNLLLAHPRYTTEEIPCAASSIWLWDSLSYGGSPFYNRSLKSQNASLSPTTTSTGAEQISFGTKAGQAANKKMKRRRMKPCNK